MLQAEHNPEVAEAGLGPDSVRISGPEWENVGGKLATIQYYH